MNQTRQPTQPNATTPRTQRFSLTAANKHHGRTVEEFLNDTFPYFRVEDWAETLAGGTVLIDQSIGGLKSTLLAKQRVVFDLINYVEEPVDSRWVLCWQNADLMVVHKPALLPVHRTTRNVIHTLTDLVRAEARLPEAQVMHRLDIETAGLVLMAKTKATAQLWQPKLKTILNQKAYEAIVYGQPSWQQLEFTSQLVERRDGAIRCQMHVEQSKENGKLSVTHFRLVKSFGDYSVVRCELVTGRKHQIRAHLSHLGHPIVGDKIYAHQGEYYLKRIEHELNAADFKELKTPHHLLVAKSFQLSLDETSEQIELPADLYPEAWTSFLASIVHERS